MAFGSHGLPGWDYQVADVPSDRALEGVISQDGDEDVTATSLPLDMGVFGEGLELQSRKR